MQKISPHTLEMFRNSDQVAIIKSWSPVSDCGHRNNHKNTERRTDKLSRLMTFGLPMFS